MAGVSFQFVSALAVFFMSEIGSRRRLSLVLTHFALRGLGVDSWSVNRVINVGITI